MNKNTLTTKQFKVGFDITPTVFTFYDFSQDHVVSGKGKAILVQVGTDPEISRRLRLLGRKVSHTHRPPLLPRKYPWYSRNLLFHRAF